MGNQNIYQTNGFEDRKEYLFLLAMDFYNQHSLVYSLALQMGPKEDFKGLIKTLEDMYQDRWYGWAWECPRPGSPEAWEWDSVEGLYPSTS